MNGAEIYPRRFNLWGAPASRRRRSLIHSPARCRRCRILWPRRSRRCQTAEISFAEISANLHWRLQSAWTSSTIPAAWTAIVHADMGGIDTAGILVQLRFARECQNAHTHPARGRRQFLRQLRDRLESGIAGPPGLGGRWPARGWHCHCRQSHGQTIRRQNRDGMF